MPETVRLVFSGNSPEALAASLLRVAAASRGVADADLSEAGEKLRLRVIVSNLSGPRSFDDAVDYARGEILAGIAVAGGSLHDGTHVEIQWLNGRFPGESLITKKSNKL